MSTPNLTATPEERLRLRALAASRPARRQARSASVQFRPDLSAQVDFLRGTPCDAVPPDHLAWKVLKFIESLDLSSASAKASPLGRMGFHPAHLLGALLLGSVTGLHQCSKIERALQTDSAFRLVSGGHAISVSVLRKARREGLLLYKELNDELIARALSGGLLDLGQTAVDSVRLEADASEASIRTLERSTRMVEQLAKRDTSELSSDQLTKHHKRLEKHEFAVHHCKDMGVTNFSVTDPLAALMKFPNGGSKPGHRLTTVVAGASARFCLAVFLSSRPTDHGLLRPMLESLRAQLICLGFDSAAICKVAVDAGFCNEDDLQVAHTNELGAEVVLSQQAFVNATTSGPKGKFGKDKFTIEGDLATCPAGRLMAGPYANGGGSIRWLGVGCKTCAMRDQCSDGERRKLTHRPATAQLRQELAHRAAQPENQALYSKRGAVVESMYSVLQDAMGFRRASSRHQATVQAEIMLKVLAYNMTRLWSAQDRTATTTSKAAAATKSARQGAPAADHTPNPTPQFTVVDTDGWPSDLTHAVVDFVQGVDRAGRAGAAAGRNS